MDTRFVKRIVAFVYAMIMLFIAGLGFCYTNESNDYFRENSVYINDYWKVNGKFISFPYSDDETFTISNTLPLVYGDQLLIIKSYYKSFTVSIDGTEILESRKNMLLGHETYVGKKEIWIPLSPEYSNKQIDIRITPQRSLYGSEITEAFISTRSAYCISQLKNNIPSVILFLLLQAF